MRKTVICIFTTVLLVGLVPQFVIAGGVDNKQNLSADYIGSASRNAAIDGSDIAAYNPAGIMQLENGMYFELDTQFLSLDYSHTYGDEAHEMTGLPIVPSIFSIYKQDKWAAYGTFTILGGGGLVEYDEGNIITEAIGNAASAGLFAAYGLPGGSALTDGFAGAKSIYYAFTAGGSYALNDMISVSAGARSVITTKEVDIHGTYAGAEILGKYEQDSDAFGGVVGLNYRPNEKVNVAFKYETKLNLDWETVVDPDTKGTPGEYILIANGLVDGESYARDLAAVFATGVLWNVTPEFSISPSFTLYFDEDADWGDVQNEARDGNSYDIAISAGNVFSEKLSATAGYMYTATGMAADGYGLIEKMSPPLDCNTIALGTKYKYSEKITLSFGLMGCFYVSETAAAVPLAGTPEVEYAKTNYIGALNLQYSFF
ncbi:MAG: outer membrane protein transport protein [Gemmatimonadales bacterium]|nr:outer membrane protein transport protein [Gemmatimonadales bacterium]